MLNDNVHKGLEAFWISKGTCPFGVQSNSSGTGINQQAFLQLANRKRNVSPIARSLHCFNVSKLGLNSPLGDNVAATWHDRSWEKRCLFVLRWNTWQLIADTAPNNVDLLGLRCFAISILPEAVHCAWNRCWSQQFSIVMDHIPTWQNNV